MASWQKDYDRLWRELVPSRGRATTLQGELIRCIGGLTDEAYRNGNENWGPMFERMLDFVENTLTDTDVFDQTEIDRITSCARKVRASVEKPDLSGKGSCYYFLAEKAVQWCRRKAELIPISNLQDESE